jgi:hypothetical protein
MRVYDVLEEGLLTLRPELDAPARRARLEALIERVGLRADALQRHPHEFSGGQRQRIAIARALMLSPALLNLRNQVRIGIHHQHAGITVDHHEIIVANQASYIGQPDDRRFRQASRHNRRVRGCTSKFDRKGACVTPKQQIGRFGFGSDHHERVERFASPKVLNPVAQHGTQHPVDDLPHIDHPLTQVWILKGQKLFDKLFRLRRVRPFCVTGLMANSSPRTFNQSGIHQHLAVDVQHRSRLNRSICRQVVCDRLQFGLNTRNRNVESVELGRHFTRCDPALGRIA